LKLSSKKLPTWLKYLFAFIPLVWVFSTINLHGMMDALLKTSWWALPLVTVTVLLSMFIQGIRWWMLLKSFLPDISFSRIMNHHFTAIFYSLVLPTSAAQDVVRSVLLSKKNDYAVAWGATWMTRILGLVVLALLSLFGIIFIDKHSLPHSFFVSLIISFSVLILLCFLSFSKRITSLARAVIRKRFPSSKLLDTLENVRNGIFMYRHKKKDVLLVLGVTLIVQIMLVGYTSVIIKGLSGHFYIMECLTYIPIIEILCLSIPLTPSGLGIREVLLKLMFTRIGLSDEQLGVYITLGFMAIVLKLVGGIPVALTLLKTRQEKSV
jgi:uncharacterized protein (TIRG00374 family)